MSDPADPFGGGGGSKTVLRLNPGGRRPAPPSAPVPQAPAPQQPTGGQQSSSSQNYRPPGPAPYVAPPSYQGSSAGQQGSQGARPDEWFSPPPPPPPPSGAASGGRALILKRDVPVAANDNVMIEAAGPMLLLLGRLRTSLMSANFANLMEQVADAIEDFEKKMRAEQVPQEKSDMAKYAICATADDIVQHIPSDERHVWAQYSMLSRFFGERVGGVRFYEKLDQAKMDPTTNYDVLELMYACLAIGFQGIHRTSQGGMANLQMIQRNLYELLRKVRPKTQDDLSPHWRGQSLPSDAATFRIPLWVLSALAAALLFALYLTLRYLLSGNAQAVTDEMRRLFGDGQITLERAAVAVPAAPIPIRASTQLERIRSKMEAEIAAKKADAVESGTSIIIRVGSFATFASGSANVLDEFKPLAVKIGDALEKEPGEVKIVGHTDNVKIATARFASNFELSVERANAVAALLRERISDKGRFKVDGKGDSVPLASNDTAEGRARNRRVEISIPREETIGAK